MVTEHVLPLSCHRKKLQNLSTSDVASKFSSFESSWLLVWGLLQEKVYRICITDLDELKQRMRTECAKLDHVVIVAATCQWRRR